MDSFATEAAAAPDGVGGVIVVGMTTAAGVAFCETLTFIVCAARPVDSFAMQAAAAPDGAGGVIAVDICTAADVCVEPKASPPLAFSTWSLQQQHNMHHKLFCNCKKR